MEEQVRKLSNLITRTAPCALLLSAVLFYAAPLVIWLISVAADSAARHSPGIDVLGVYRSLIGTTLLLSIAGASLALILGSSTALFAVSGTKRTRELLTLAMTVPLLMGFIAWNYAWVGLLSQFAGQSHVFALTPIAQALLYRRLGI